MKLTIRTFEKSPGLFSIALGGMLDSNTSMTLEKEVDSILANRPHTVIFDMEDLDFISSAGLRIVAKTKKALKPFGGTFLAVNMQPQIREVFDIIKALPGEQIFESVQELDDYLMVRQHRNIEERNER
jgi:anti-anti-sigma factor